MFIAYAVAAVISALANAGTATAKLRRVERVTAGLTAAGVPASWFPALALLNYAGAAGLLIGIAWRPLGIAAALGLSLYYAGALVFHIRARDTQGMPMPAILLAASLITLSLAIASA